MRYKKLINIGIVVLCFSGFIKPASSRSSRTADPNWQLRHAALSNKPQAAREALAAGANRLKKGFAGELPIHDATKEGNLEIARILLGENKKSQLNAQNDHGESPLFYTIELERTILLNYLLEQGANRLQRNNYQQLPIHQAAEKSLDMVISLLSKDIDKQINAPDEFGWTPLIYAAFRCQPKIVKFLLSHEANKALKTKNGEDVFTLLARIKLHLDNTIKEKETDFKITQNPHSIEAIKRCRNDLQEIEEIKSLLDSYGTPAEQIKELEKVAALKALPPSSLQLIGNYIYLDNSISQEKILE